MFHLILTTAVSCGVNMKSAPQPPCNRNVAYGMMATGAAVTITSAVLSRPTSSSGRNIGIFLTTSGLMSLFIGMAFLIEADENKLCKDKGRLK